jgi:hypothetical protein
MPNFYLLSFTSRIFTTTISHFFNYCYLLPLSLSLSLSDNTPIYYNNNKKRMEEARGLFDSSLLLLPQFQKLNYSINSPKAERV